MKRMIADIGDHLEERLGQLVEDTIDTCGRADLSYKESASMVASVLAVAFADACSEFRMPREVFIKLCAIAAEGRFTPRRRSAQRKRKRPAGGLTGRSR